MNVMRWRVHALALYAIGLVACSDAPTATELDTSDAGALSARSGPLFFERSVDDPGTPPPPEPETCVTGTEEYLATIAPERVCGYDPSIDLSPTEADIAAMQARVDATNAYVQAAQAGAPNLGDPCYATFLKYYSAVGAFVITAARTLFWVARRNPPAAWRWAQATGGSLVAVNVVYAELYGCRYGPTRPTV